MGCARRGLGASGAGAATVSATWSHGVGGLFEKERGNKRKGRQCYQYSETDLSPGRMNQESYLHRRLLLLHNYKPGCVQLCSVRNPLVGDLSSENLHVIRVYTRKSLSEREGYSGGSRKRGGSYILARFSEKV